MVLIVIAIFFIKKKVYKVTLWEILSLVPCALDLLIKQIWLQEEKA